MLATDRDLLVLEPGLFSEIAWLGQRLCTGTALLDTTLLLTLDRDVLFDRAGVETGHVILLDDVPYEVVERLLPEALTVSRLRDDPVGALIDGPPQNNKPFAVYTLRPQIRDANRRVLRMIGLDPDAADGAGESAVTNPGDLRRLVALGALHLAWSGAAAAGGPESAAGRRAELYRERFAEERGRVVARLDLDGDGVAEVARRPSVAGLTRV